MTDFIAEIAVDNTNFSFDKLFSYAVPDSLINEVAVGKRVMIPFGSGNRSRQGMIMNVNNGDVKGLKTIISVLDKEPVVTEEMLRLAVFIKEHCFCTYYDGIRTMLPAGINYNVTTTYTAVKGIDTGDLNNDELQIYSFVSASRSPVKKEKITETLGLDLPKVLDSLVNRGYLRKNDEAFRRVGDAVMKMVAINDNADFSSKLSPKQNAVFDLLQTVGSASVKELCYYTGVTPSVVDNLVKKNLAFYYEDEVFRSIKSEVKADNKPIVLTDEQQKAYIELLEKYNSNAPQVSLLYGITGSGKTSVFMKLIEKAIEDNMGVIVMVPEISLTPQFLSIFKSKFGENVAVFHSGLSMGERLDEYKRVKRGAAKIAVGTRSAVFAPFENIGLIIMDEEQEHTYKSESTPRYHARDVAKFRAKEHNCLLLLSSATPDVESYYYATSGRYSLSRLTNRYGNAVLPNVKIVDMNEELAIGNHSMFSTDLLNCIEENLVKDNQSILLLNRRGHNTFAYCSSCRETLICPNCSISLTYHSANHKLMCHYCGYSLNYTKKCPTCGQDTLRFGGAGTQKVEEELQDLFPNARILRLDADATMRKSSYERKLSAFSQGDYDILIGTQMVAKGLNFPKVTLVGVLNPDSMLYADDYRSFERAFSLLTQVVGRSGRGDSKGIAIIQTNTPENVVISMAAAQNYEDYFNSEIVLRKAMLYPPFADICMVGFVAVSRLLAANAAKEFTDKFIAFAKDSYSDIPLRILGPSPASVTKISNKYRYKIIIKCRNQSRFRKLLTEVLTEYNSLKEYKNVTAYIDMNALSF